MMRAKKCDRCGKFYGHYEGQTKFRAGERANALHLIDRDLDEKYWSRKPTIYALHVWGNLKNSFVAALLLLLKRRKCDGTTDAAT